ncbi:type II secretion system protein GspL [Vibrio sp. 10N.261.46.E12]|uniref:type II secretion system protein GspL n=1 Tax=unclassified Vibrio TaxID=2614977 RepID=UPI0009774274|nr:MULTISPECIES: type II secretion system protein GspL [unclassified Vibrio]OMO38407.1 type II secretion system protein GspL [Vibrio sp. 10N.261.45.E1]PMJ26098.1 type II secretion system protein GspL [Vibrio sp. 10N.286.45.B6]PML89589.1 type II secretion system protein GspL [Vibrio sp. 10N.261.49.E11]PMM69743.1 type II secretion system protein GspL [Vibrio sp. 10N.261.46.F12]PMM90659.1 type II secretion system protein GspL [Vibrio sp. 10N.261.46.E8]
MSEFLTVRLSSEPQSPVQWLVWSTSQQEVIASGELSSWEQLDELTPYAEKRSCIALLPGNECLIKRVEIPKGAARQFDSMLPFLLEDEVAQDIEDLHLTILDKDATHATVCGVDREWLKQALDLFREANIIFRKVLPDTLAVPFEEQGISALQIDQHWLLRQGTYQAVSISEAWLPMFLQSDWVVADDEEQATTIFSYTAMPSDDVQQQSGVNWQAKPAELVMSLLSQQAITSGVNLLTGTFKTKSSFSKYWRVWQKVAIAACLLVAVIVTQQVLKVQQYEAQAQAYRMESERIFRTVLPGKQRIPTVSYLKRQMNDEAKKYGGSGDGDSLLGWLALLPETLGQVKSIEVESIRYDGNRSEIRLQAKSSDFQHFETARVKLEEKFTVEQGPLNRNGDAVFGSFTLKPHQ